MRIAIASDHAGHRLKEDVAQRLLQAGFEVLNLGAGPEPSDYPLSSEAVGRAVASGEAERGVLVCGSGIGVAIAANKVPGIRAATIGEPVSARLCREHNDVNVICLGERLIGPEMAWECVRVFLATNHSEMGRHAERVRQIGELENGRS
ncbi:MAG: ribose 5-phosphate isomerase B [Candidatus Sericytochromatia bacterium]|nr:ribose 5-phosphate isomerase B [Candidatus Sericytochromatia bacterium]